MKTPTQNLLQSGRFLRSPYSHAAIYQGNGQVIEATTFHPSGSGVAHTDLHTFAHDYKDLCIVRPAYPDPNALQNALAQFFLLKYRKNNA
jgi:hypothetical protein